MQVTDESVSVAIDAARKHARDVMGVSCEIEPEIMRVALEAVLGARPTGDAPDLVVFFRRSADPTENEAANCIEELTEALKPVAALTFLDEGPSGQPVPRLYDAEIIRRARATLERWG